MKLKISASILSANFGKLNEEIASIESYIDELHVDVMDGHFVPNLTFGQVVVKDIESSLKKNCHLMVENPVDLLEAFHGAGVDMVIVHAEVFEDVKKLEAALKKIHELGMEAGISVKPKTPASAIAEFLDQIEEVLVMTVEPGFGGQEFMLEVLPKITELRKLAPELDIAVDGGINSETAKLAAEAGANVLVAGSYIFHAKDRVKAIEALRV